MDFRLYKFLNTLFDVNLFNCFIF